MNLDYERQLEACISRELKRLPELPAPDSLAVRVLAAIERQERAPWYRRSWQTWHPALRWAVFAVLVALFGCLCLAGATLPHSPTILSALRGIESRLSGFTAVGTTFEALVDSGLLVLKKFGSGLLVSCSVALALGYALCLTAGTLYLRLAAPKHNRVLP